MGALASTRVGDLFSMQGRVVILTGGCSHLGLAMAQALAEAGACVDIASRRGELCRQVADEMSSHGYQVHGHECDVSQPQEVEALVDRVVKRGGRIDGMVCNAGGAEARGPFVEMSLDEMDRSFRLNVVGTALCARAAAKYMIRSGSGSIVLIGSIHGSLGPDCRAYSEGYAGSGADYYIAKGAVVNMARALAMEWAPFGVRVNCLSPGQIPNPSLGVEQRMMFENATPLGRVGVPSDLSGALLLLVSDAGSFLTGHNLVVDGGWSAR